MFCKCDTPASKRYQRDVRWFLLGYFVAVFVSAWFVKHGAGEGVARYFWSILPTIPIVGVIVRMGKYLQEETDEYLRLTQMKSILAGTGTLLTAVVISDFLRAFAHAPDFAPFVLFFCFAAGMAAMQLVQWMHNRVPSNE
jgi:hypothetical protein